MSGSPNKAKAKPFYKSPTLDTPVKPHILETSKFSHDLGLNYYDKGSNGSISSEEDCNQPVDGDSLLVKYHALKRQLKHMDDEKDRSLYKISKLKEKAKSYERQWQKAESDRKNQLNVMKSTHEQAANEKAKLVSLYESIIREQEAELEALRKTRHSDVYRMSIDFSSSQGGAAISRLTTHINQIMDEKNDILAQFCSQQHYIKDQQQELKQLIRCRSENTELQSQLDALNKVITSQKKQLEVECAKTSKLQGEKNCQVQSTHTKEEVQKLEEQITKLQDKLLIKEAEFAEMDLNYRQKLHSQDSDLIDRNQEIRELKQEIFKLRSQPQQVVEKVREVPVESEALKKHLALLQADILTLKDDKVKLESEHELKLNATSQKLKSDINKLEQELQVSQTKIEKLNKELQTKRAKESEDAIKHQSLIEELEKQLKAKKTESNKLRQEMADKIVELEQKKDTELEEIEKKLKQGVMDLAKDYANIKAGMRKTQAELSLLKTNYRDVRKVLVDLGNFYNNEILAVTKQVSQAIRDTDEANKDLVRKYRKEMSLRKKYHNELVELKGNIRVFCRVRPAIKEDGASPNIVVAADNDDEDVLWVENSKGRSQTFEMDRLFTSDISQTQVFEEVKAIVTSCVDGYHVCIFAYGQTGSGKTYTMEGVQDNPGINQRALMQLFDEAEERSKDWSYCIQVSAIEIYNEAVRDLLSTTASDKLEIKLNQEGNLHVPGLSWVGVNNVHDVNKVFAIGHKNRSTASTNMNEHSSRSHALLCIEVTGINKTTGAKTLGKLNLVDLAGSERVSKSGADGARLKEAQYINKSLSALGDVIAALRNKQTFVPYRNSKLTYLLQDSLGGDSKVLMIVQVAPVESHVNETLCSLNFAQRVRSVELGMASKKLDNVEKSTLKDRLIQSESQSPLNTPTKQSTSQGTPRRK